LSVSSGVAQVAAVIDAADEQCATEQQGEGAIGSELWSGKGFADANGYIKQGQKTNPFKRVAAVEQDAAQRE